MPASPAMCSTRHSASSRSSDDATASVMRATACEPPKTSSSRSSGWTPKDRRAAWRSAPSNERIGVPETKARPGKARQGRRERDRHPGRHAAHRRGRPAGHHVALPDQGRDTAGSRGHDQRDAQVPAAGEDRAAAAGGRAGAQACGTDAARRSGSVTRCAFMPPLRSERTIELVVRQIGLRGHDPSLQATDAADVGQLKPGLRVAQGPCDGQRGVHVPAGPAARHQIPHRAMILSGWSRARSTAGCRPPRGSG